MPAAAMDDDLGVPQALAVIHARVREGNSALDAGEVESARAIAGEVMVMTGRIFDRIVDPEGQETIEDIIADGEYYGMQTFDQSLFGLYKNGLVSLRDAMGVSSHPHDFRIALQQAGLSTTY